MVSEIVELTVVGIRNYCPGEEEGLPVLFGRLPVGKTLFLKINPTGSRFPGSVSVYDGIGNMIGSISKTDRRFIELAIPKDGMLPCKVVGHSLEHNCMYVEAENNVGFKEPYIRQTSVEEGELIFGITEEDERLKTLTLLMQTQLNIPTPEIEELVELANEYAMICCTSLDGETSFTRADILRQLKKLNNGSRVFDGAINKIFEDTKDLGRKYNDVKTKVYRNQYDRIFASANTKKNGKSSELETYIKSLTFRNRGNLTLEVIESEVEKLSHQLANEFMGTFVQASETDEDFASALYSLNYSIRAIYVLYTRRIKREYLLGMLENPNSLDNNPISNSIAQAYREPLEESYNSLASSNQIFNTRILTTEALYKKVHVTLLLFIKQDGVTSDVEQINPSAQNEWYYIMKGIRESGITNGSMGDTKFAEQMVVWFPDLFAEKIREDDSKNFVRNFAKSISAERNNYWTQGAERKEIPISDMHAHARTRRIDNGKVKRAFLIANGLKKALEELKTEIQKAQNVR